MATHSRIVLDTSAYSRLRQGDPGVIEAVARAEVVYLPTVVLGELQAGFRLGSRLRENEQSLSDLLEESFVLVLDVTSEVSLRYGELFAALRRAGTPIPVNDIWIAATTLCAGAHLVTLDSDFQHLEGLPLTILPAVEP